MTAVSQPLCFVGVLNWHVAQEIAHWIMTHKVEVAMKWLAIAFLVAALWSAWMMIFGHQREE